MCDEVPEVVVKRSQPRVELEFLQFGGGHGLLQDGVSGCFIITCIDLEVLSDVLRCKFLLGYLTEHLSLALTDLQQTPFDVQHPEMHMVMAIKLLGNLVGNLHDEDSASPPEDFGGMGRGGNGEALLGEFLSHLLNVSAGDRFCGGLWRGHHFVQPCAHREDY